jgi:hypothetical protein
MGQSKSAFVSSYINWPQQTGLLLFGSARPPFLGEMRTGAIAVEASASGLNAYYRVYRNDPPAIDTDKYCTSGTANSAGYIPIRKQYNDSKHHLDELPPHLSGLSGVTK